MNVVDILHECKLFSAVPAPSFQRLVAIAQLRHFPKGHLVFREDDACPGVFVVGQGMVRVFKASPGGKEHVLHMVGPGSTFAEVASIGGFNVPASAEAVEETTCVLLPQDRLRKAMADDHDLCLGMMTGLTFWVRHLVGLMEDIVLRDAAGRLARYLLEADSTEEDTVELPGLKRHVASHLNLTSETFSRTIRRLIEAGLIEQTGSAGVRILNRAMLRRVAEGLFPKL